MEFLIYTIGDFEWSETVFRSLAMAFDPGSGVFGQANVLFGLGLLLSFFAGALKGIMEKGTVSFSMVVKGYLLWILLFVPRVDVVLESKSLGYASFFTDIPVGLAIGGAISTQVPMAFIDILEDVFTMPQSAGTNLDALRTLVSLEKNVNGNSVRTLGGSPNIDLISTLDNYITGCVFKDIRLSPAFQEAKYRNILSQINSWDQMKVSSTVWYIESHLDNASSLGTVLSCKEAYEKLDNQFSSDTSAFSGAMFMLAEQDLTNYALNGDVSQHIDEYLFQLGSASVSSMDVMVNNFLNYHFMKNAANLPASDSLRGKLVDAMEFQTKEQRLFNMAGDRNLWLEMAPATISFFEAFVWFCAPLMSFLVLFGDGGLKLALGYFRMLLLVGMYPLIMILVNLYLDWSIQRALEPTLISGEAFTIGGLSNFYSESRSYIATASYMTTFIPMLAYMMLKGGEYAAVSMANRIGASTHIDTSPVAPNIAAGMKNGSLKMGSNNWGVTDNGMVHTRSGSPDINAPMLSGMSGLNSSLGIANQQAQQSASANESSFNRTFSSFYNTGMSGGFDASTGSGSNANLSENNVTMAKLTSSLSQDKSTSDVTARSLIAKLMGVASVGGGVGFNGGSTHDVSNSNSSTNTSSTSDGTRTSDQDGNYRGRQNQTANQSAQRNTNGGKTGVSLKMSAEGKVSVEGSGGIQLNSDERDALSRGLTRMRDEQVQKGAAFSLSNMESSVNKLSEQSGWGERGQEVYSAHKKWSESESRMRSVSQALQETNGFNLSNKTDFSGAANREEFTQWVQRGYRSQEQFDQLSEKEQNSIYDQRGRAIAENMQHTGLDRGRAAAVLFASEMNQEYQGIAQSGNLEQMQGRLQQLSSRFNEAGHLTNDNNLKLMGSNFSNLAGKLGAVEYKTPEELNDVANQTNQKFDDVKTKAKADLTHTKAVVEDGPTAVKMHHDANVQDVNSASPLETKNWSKLDAANRAMEGVNVTKIPDEMAPLFNDATKGLSQVAANTAAMFYSKTAEDLSGLSGEKLQHLNPALMEGAAMLTSIRPDFSGANEATYGAAVAAKLADSNTLNSDNLQSPTGKAEHNLAVKNIETLRSQMDADPQFKAEVDGLASGAYTVDGLMNYKQFMEGGVSGYVSVPTNAYSEVLAVGAHLGTQFSDDQMNTLLKDSAINTRFHEVKNDMMQSGYPDISKSSVMNEVASQYYNASSEDRLGEMIDRGNNSMQREIGSYGPQKMEQLGPYSPKGSEGNLPPAASAYSPTLDVITAGVRDGPSSVDGTLDPFDLDHGSPNYIDGRASPMDPDSDVKLS